MDAAASLNPLTPQRPHYPVRARTNASVSGHGGRAPGHEPVAKVATQNAPAASPAGQTAWGQADPPPTANQLRREGYGYGAQLALRSYHAAAHADVEIHRIDTYA